MKDSTVRCNDKIRGETLSVLCNQRGSIGVNFNDATIEICLDTELVRTVQQATVKICSVDVPANDVSQWAF